MLQWASITGCKVSSPGKLKDQSLTFGGQAPIWKPDKSHKLSNSQKSYKFIQLKFYIVLSGGLTWSLEPTHRLLFEDY